MKKLSIIVLCDQAENVIDKCMNSLVNQAIRQDAMELICIDHASTDRTFEKLCEWEQQYPELIMVIQCEEKVNDGQFKNIGLQYAGAEYVGFVNPGDPFLPDMWESLVHASILKNSDVSILRLRADAEEDLDHMVTHRLYRNACLREHQLAFPESKCYENFFFNKLISHYTKRIVILKEDPSQNIDSLNRKSVTLISKTNTLIKKLDYFDSHVLLVSELKMRGICSTQDEIDFIKFLDETVRDILTTYGMISIDLFDTMCTIAGDLLRDSEQEVLDLYESIILSLKKMKELNEPPYSLDDLDHDRSEISKYSYWVEERGSNDDFEKMNQIVLESDTLTLYNLFYYWSQARRIMGRNQKLCDRKNLLEQIYKRTYLGYERECQDLLTPIIEDERNENLIYVITLQFIGLQHPPTRTALERIEVLIKQLHKTVKVINTREPMTTLGEIPMYATQKGSINDAISGSRMQHYNGMQFTLMQSEAPMPEIMEVRKILMRLKEEKPYLILAIGNGSIVADLASHLIPVINIPVVFSSYWIRKGQYTATGRRFTKEEIRSAFHQNELPVNLIESTFTFRMKPQEKHLTKEDLGLPKNRFLMLVVGTRLHDEVDDDFIQMIQPLLQQNGFLVFAGEFNNYEDYCR
ncbi:MAG: glycosyltransferase family 2 protein, partial [Clostridia bacterium]|nr:glycosyltransferase family 2 protein [Clostridia bacterium]